LFDFFKHKKQKAMKTTRYFLIILGVMLLSIVSCEKPNLKPEEADYEYVLTEVEGTLMVRGSHEVIKDQRYKIGLRVEPIYFGFEEPMTEKNELLETYTDENGHYKLYHLSRRTKSASEHKYALSMPDGLMLDSTFRGDLKLGISPAIEGYYNNEREFYSGFKGTANLMLNKKAWIRLHIENVNPQPGDRIRLEFPIDRYTQIIEGPANFEVLLYGIGNDYNALNYWITKNGVPIGLQTDSIMLGEMDTTYYKFEY
jgi:hypothetical protein